MMVKQKTNEWPIVSYVLNVLLVIVLLFIFMKHTPKDVTRLERYHAFMEHCVKLPGMDFAQCDGEYDEVIQEIAGRK